MKKYSTEDGILIQVIKQRDGGLCFATKYTVSGMKYGYFDYLGAGASTESIKAKEAEVLLKSREHIVFLTIKRWVTGKTV